MKLFGWGKSTRDSVPTLPDTPVPGAGPVLPDRNMTREQWIDHVIDELARLDGPERVMLDFVSTPDVQAFCEAVGMEKSWAGRTISDIAPADARMGVAVVPADEARIVLRMMSDLIDSGRFSSEESETPLTPELIDDYREDRGGDVWEFGYALAVELEHGRTRGTNVTNNHPLLTGLVVLAHLAEDPLYYARLIVMEQEGELARLIASGEGGSEVAALAERLARAEVYRATRVSAKYGAQLGMPTA